MPCRRDGSRLAVCPAAVYSAGAAGLRLPCRCCRGRRRGRVRTGDLIGEPSFYLTHGDETLLDIALRAQSRRARDLGRQSRASIRGFPRAETLLTLPTQFILPDAPRKGIVVNYGDLRLYHFRQGRLGRDLRHRRRPGRVRAEVRPDQDRPQEGAADLVPDRVDPARQALGRHGGAAWARTIRWATTRMYLGWPTYLIHGTNKPYGVGRRVSRGCIRMYPEGVERLFAEIPVGTPVTAVNQLVKLGWHMGELYLEAQPDFAQIDELEETQGISPRPVDRRGPPADHRPRRCRGRRGSTGRWPRPSSSSAAACRSRSRAAARRWRGHACCRRRRRPPRRAGSPIEPRQGGLLSTGAHLLPACPRFSRDIPRNASPTSAAGARLRAAQASLEAPHGRSPAASELLRSLSTATAAA